MDNLKIDKEINKEINKYTYIKLYKEIDLIYLKESEGSWDYGKSHEFCDNIDWNRDNSIFTLYLIGKISQYFNNIYEGNPIIKIKVNELLFPKIEIQKDENNNLNNNQQINKVEATNTLSEQIKRIRETTGYEIMEIQKYVKKYTKDKPVSDEVIIAFIKYNSISLGVKSNLDMDFKILVETLIEFDCIDLIWSECSKREKSLLSLLNKNNEIARRKAQINKLK